MDDWRILVLGYVFSLLSASCIFDLLKKILFDILWGKNSPQRRLSIHRVQPFWCRATLSYLPATSHRHPKPYIAYRRIYRVLLVLIPIVLALLIVIGLLNIHLSILLTWGWNILQLALYVMLRVRFDSNRVSCYRGKREK